MTPRSTETAPIEFAPPRWGAALALALWLVGAAVGVALLLRPGMDASTRLAGAVLVPIAGWCVFVYAGQAWRPHPWVRLDAEGLHTRWRRSEAPYSVAWADLAAVRVQEGPFLRYVAVAVRDPARLPPEGAAFWAGAETGGAEFGGAEADPGRVPEFLLIPAELRTTAETLRDAIAGSLRAESGRDPDPPAA